MSNPTCSCFSARGFTDLSLLLRVVIEIRNAWRKFEGEDSIEKMERRTTKRGEIRTGEGEARLARNKEGRDDEEGAKCLDKE